MGLKGVKFVVRVGAELKRGFREKGVKVKKGSEKGFR